MQSALKVGGAFAAAAALAISFSGSHAIAGSSHWGGGHDPKPSHGSVPKVILISLDGAKPQFIDKYISMGVLPSDSGLGLLREGGSPRGSEHDRDALAYRGLARGHRDRLHGGTQQHSVQHLPSCRRSDRNDHKRIWRADRRLPDQPARPHRSSDRRATVVEAARQGPQGGDRDLAGRRWRRHQDQRCHNPARRADAHRRLHGPVRRLRRARCAGLHPDLGKLCARCGNREPARRCRPSLVQPGAGLDGTLRDAVLRPGRDGNLRHDQCERTYARLQHEGRRARYQERPAGALRHAGVLQRRPGHPARAVRLARNRSRVCEGGRIRALLLRGQRERGRRRVLCGQAWRPTCPRCASLATGPTSFRAMPPLSPTSTTCNTSVGFWAPQPDFRIPERLSPGFTNFTDEELEAIYEDQVETFTIYQTELALHAIDENPNADLVMLYFEEPDGSSHQFLLTDPRQASDPTQCLHDRRKSGQGQGRSLCALRQSRYRRANDAVEAIIKKVGTRHGVPRSNVIVVSDHGFAPFHTAVGANNLLSAALVSGGFQPNAGQHERRHSHQRSGCQRLRQSRGTRIRRDRGRGDVSIAGERNRRLPAGRRGSQSALQLLAGAQEAVQRRHRAADRIAAGRASARTATSARTSATSSPS